MPKYNNDFQDDLRKNRPNKAAAIINTVLSGVVLIGVIILKVLAKEFSWTLFFAFIIVLIMFPISSWYYFYFSKKQKTKMLKSFEEETSLIVEYMSHQKNFKQFTDTEARSVVTKFNQEPVDILFSYNIEKSSLGFPDANYSLLSIGIGFTCLVINPENNKVIGLTGLLPKSVWVKKHLKFNGPTRTGSIEIIPTGFDFRPKTLFQMLQQEDTYYNKKTGMLCIGDPKIYSIDDITEFIKDGYLVTRDDKIISLWLKLPINLEIY